MDPFSESADELFEEASLSEIGTKIQNGIKKIIAKIKKLYADLKDKFAAAKYAHILKSKAASSTRQIRYNMRDREITKAVKELMAASNKSCVSVKKLEQAYIRGKITTEQLYDRIDVIATDLEREIDRIMDSPYGRSVQHKLEDTYACDRVQSYCQKLLNYQQKTCEELRKSIEAEEARLLHEAAELERAKAELAAEAKRKASVKYKLAQWYARTNKKVLGSVVAAIGAAAAISAFAVKLGLNKKSKAINESAEDDMFDESSYDDLTDPFGFSENDFMEEADDDFGEFDEFLESYDLVDDDEFDAFLESSEDDSFDFEEPVLGNEIDAIFGLA